MYNSDAWGQPSWAGHAHIGQSDFYLLRTYATRRPAQAQGEP